MTSISLPGASGSCFVRSVFTCWACVAVANPKVKINTERMSFFMLCIASVLSVMCCDNRLNRSCVADTHSASNPLDRRDEEVTLDEKVCSFRRTHLRSDFVKRLTFNSGSFHCISDGEDPKSKEISWQRPFNTYFLFIVRSRNSCINDPIRSTSSSNAKWPVSRRWSSALGISLLKSSAPSTVKIPSFLPQVISMGGCCLRKYSCQSA